MWEIYSVGNATFLTEVFRGVARLWSTGNIYVLLSTGLIIGLIWNSLQWAVNQEKAPFPAKGFILSIVFVVGLLGPQSLVDVRVTSKRDFTFEEIHNVPLLPALGGWLITNSGTALADLMSQAFSYVGIENTWKALSPMQNFVSLSDINISDACTPNPADKGFNICKSLTLYLNDCYVKSNNISPSASKNIDAVMNANSKDILANLKVSNVNLFTYSYLVPGNSGGAKMSCPSAWNSINSAMKSTSFKVNMEKSLAAQGLELEEVNVFLKQYSSQGAIPSAESSFDLANTAFLGSVFRDYFTSSDYGRQVSRAMFDTMRQRQLANASKKEYWMENAEVMQSFLEALTVFLTPFLGLVLAISGQGLMAVGQYFAAWMFVQLWSVMIVLVNLFTALAMTNRFTDAVSAGKNQFTLSAIDSQFATANSYIGMAGMLYTFIPAICVFVLYRGVHAMQGMSRQAMADPNINAQRLSPDTGATYQNGGAQFGNQTSQLQVPTGRHIGGDVLASSSIGTMSANSSMGSGATTGAQQASHLSNSYASNAQKALDNVFGKASSGNYDFNASETSTFTAGTTSEYASAAQKAITDATNLTDKQAQQLIASGAVSGNVGAGFSLGFSGTSPSGIFGKIGAQANAELRASLGLNGTSSAEQQASLQESLGLTDSQIDKINSNLSRITTGSESTGFSDTASIQNSVKEAYGNTRQAQALEQQGTMLSDLASSSSQVSGSQNIDMASLAQSLKGQTLESYLSAQDPSLWERIQNSSIDGQTGGQWLENKSVEYGAERQSVSNNPVGDGRAMALKEFLKQNDQIDMKKDADGNSVGIDIGKETRDAELNRDIFGALSANGIGGSAAAAEIYDNKVATFNNMEEVANKVTAGSAALESGAPNLKESQQFNAEYNAGQEQSTAQVHDAKTTAESGRSGAETAHTAHENEFNHQGEQLTDGGVPGIAQEQLVRLDEAGETLKEQNASVRGLLDASSNITTTVADEVKPNGETAFNNFVETQVKSGGDISSYRPEYGKAIDTISKLDAFSTQSMEERLLTNYTTDDRIASRVPDEFSNAQEMINVLSNDQLMTEILGKNEDGSYGSNPSSKFDNDTITMLSEGANWLRDYENDPIARSPVIEHALARADDQEGDAARTYLHAMENLGFIQEATSGSDGKFFNTDNENASRDLSRILDAQESSNGNMRDDFIDNLAIGVDQEKTLGISSERDKVTGQLDRIEEMAGTMSESGLLSGDQQSYIYEFISDSRARIGE